MSTSSSIFQHQVVRRTLVVGAVVSAVGFVLSSSLFPHPIQAQQNAPLSAQGTQVASPNVVSGLPDFTQLVERVGPSVVNIRTTQRVNVGGAEANPMDEQMQEFFRRFFGTPMPGQPAQPRGNNKKNGEGKGEERPRGVGSGFMLTSDGYVMTNAHVIEGADEVYVTLTDKREFKAKVIGADKRTDVAVVKIEASSLPAVRIGEAGRLRVGEWVMAIGSPFGLENTVTAGIVSAKSRDTGEEIRFIQTDVAVNPGNSGGPLINMRGEVVGINSQILSRSGGFQGISFSIPIDDAMKVADQLRANGKVTRGRIGVQIEPISKELAESLGLKKPEGAVVRMVEPGGPADKAGIEAGDVIVKFNGQPVEKAGDLPRLVGSTKPGSKGVVTVFRRGAYKDLNVGIVELEPAQKAAEAKQQPAKPAEAALAKSALGLTLAELSAEQKRELKVQGGVLVQDVDGPSETAGLRAGDVILQMANAQIDNVRQFEAVLARVDRQKTIPLLVRRSDSTGYVLIRPER
ncbi:DegQ family serine endoprotease [Aquabacterium lacunae]|uniref:Probable periplasmic serine endoprotease DegP-like n=1 Tax=Aquabacterium lacunae TaxID=2528630 RepID=A0A4Q9H5A6_9BURK|nr:DegQ family serine endoprotease [Aquabacterium lacunae]TBO32507.1 DegQ family serine endoprotease [Aquabacterium lacunae]